MQKQKVGELQKVLPEVASFIRGKGISNIFSFLFSTETFQTSFQFRSNLFAAGPESDTEVVTNVQVTFLWLLERNSDKYFQKRLNFRLQWTKGH